MHGLDHSIRFTRILAIDLGKFNSVVCPYDPGTTQHSFVTIQTTPQCVHDLLVQHSGDDRSQTLVVFETCDCGGWVYDVAISLGFAVAVANKQWTLAGIAQLKSESRPLKKCTIEELWRGRLHVEIALLEMLDEQIKAVDQTLDALGGKDERVTRLQQVKGAVE